MERQVYFYQDEFNVFWIKPYDIDSNHFSFISSSDVNNIINVDTSDINLFMEKWLVSWQGTRVMKYDELDKPFTKEQQENKLIPYLFESYRDEINGDYNGDEKLFLKCKKLSINYREPANRFGKNSYKYRNIPRSTFDNVQLLIPLNEVRENYPELIFDNRLVLGTGSKKIFRRYFNNNLVV